VPSIEDPSRNVALVSASAGLSSCRAVGSEGRAAGLPSFTELTVLLVAGPNALHEFMDDLAAGDFAREASDNQRTPAQRRS